MITGFAAGTHHQHSAPETDTHPICPPSRGDVTLECPGPEPVTVLSALFEGGRHEVKAQEPPAVFLERTESGFLVSAFA
jgi:hypothetical protein